MPAHRIPPLREDRRFRHDVQPAARTAQAIPGRHTSGDASRAIAGHAARRRGEPSLIGGPHTGRYAAPLNGIRPAEFAHRATDEPKASSPAPDGTRRIIAHQQGAGAVAPSHRGLSRCHQGQAAVYSSPGMVRRRGRLRLGEAGSIPARGIIGPLRTHGARGDRATGLEDVLHETRAQRATTFAGAVPAPAAQGPAGGGLSHTDDRASNRGLRAQETCLHSEVRVSPRAPGRGRSSLLTGGVA